MGAVTEAQQLLAAGASVTPVLRDRILQVSPEDLDESAWAARVDGLDLRGQATGSPRLDDVSDLLAVIARFDADLGTGRLPLRALWATQALALALDARDRDYLVVTHTVDQFVDLLARILDSLGLANAAADLRADHLGVASRSAEDTGTTTPAAEAPRPDHITLAPGPVRAEVTLRPVHSLTLAATGAGPVAALSLTNTTDDPVVVDTLMAVLASAPETPWTGPEITVPAGETVDLDEHELAWNPAPSTIEAVGAAGGRLLGDEITLAVGAAGRSSADSRELTWVPRGLWAPGAPAELVAAFVRPADPAVAAAVEAVSRETLDVDGSPTALGALEDPAAHGPAVLTAVARTVDADLSVTADPELGPEDTTTPETPAHLRRRGHASQSERALFVAAVLESLRIPTALAVTAGGLRVGVGPSFGAESVVLTGEAAIEAELSAMAFAEGALVASEVRALVDLAAARDLAGITPVDPAGSTGGGEATDGTGSTDGTEQGSGEGASTAGPPRAVAAWKRELLDLSFGNPLLRMPQARGVDLVLPGTVLESFRARVCRAQDPLALRSHTEFVTADGELIDAEDASESALDTHLGRGTVFVRPRGGGFDVRLRRIAAEARTSQEEHGHSTLHVAVGTLTWDDPRGQQGRAPLFLLPVGITGTGRTGYRLTVEPGQGFQANRVLIERLRVDTGREDPATALTSPPTDEDGVDLAAVFESLPGQLEAAGITGAEVGPEVRLVTVAYGTMGMWKDLDEDWEALLSGPVASHLARTPFAAFRDPVPARALAQEDEDRALLPAPADSSQLAAVVAAGEGSSFVLEGPPGTGKSQTITNLIADGMARGRRILFVAEKKAALDVVHSRLKTAGLGDLVLDLHGENQSVEHVKALLRTADRVCGGDGTDPAKLPEALSAARVERSSLLARLREYPRVLHGDAEVDASGVWQAFQECLEMEHEFDTTAGWQPEEIGIPRGSAVDLDAVREVAKKVRRARRRYEGTVALDPADRKGGGSQGAAESAAEVPAGARPLREALLELRDLGFPAVAEQIARGRDGDQLAEAVRLAAAARRLKEVARASGVVDVRGFERHDVVRKYIRVQSLVETLVNKYLVGIVVDGLDETDEEFRKALAAEAPAGSSTAGTSPGGNAGAPTTVRAFMAAHGPQVLATTPCVLTSPAGVARNLPAVADMFDTVVFDEASQITTADAIGALGRAKAAVIVGDSKQMPPTTDFTVSAGTADTGTGGQDARASVPADDRPLESVLTTAVTAGFEQKRLTWHYRSQHEQLIEFPNRKYYAGRLSSFPEPPGDVATDGSAPVGEFPVDLRYVGGTYAKVEGGRKANEKEAQAVVAEVSARIRRDPRESLAVVTFNASQQAFIELALEEAAAKDPHVRAALERETEPLFVKNVASVQGDERDVVLFSTGYAPDPGTGRLSLNFGPLSRAGGERRFNVAITRARTRIVLFTSLRSTDIDVRNSRSRGLRDLRDYLQDAERGEVIRRQSVQDRSTLYRETVAERLEDAGLQVVGGVGTSSFLVDLAVRAPGSEDWAAVLLDPPRWVAPATVWDRDGLPVQALQNMGWSHVYRLLLADWLTDPDAVVAHIRKLLGLETEEEPEPEAEPATEPTADDQQAPEPTPAAEKPEPSSGRSPTVDRAESSAPEPSTGQVRPKETDLGHDLAPEQTSETTPETTSEKDTGKDTGKDAKTGR
ncbi:AAA domain-containing protein [Brevibacterium litoralis]|uniref:AAA domain-containing protein n=1 Tax=Brevibacterium litoralis TaxID=3138935 RepID=UPI0032ED82C6